MGVPEVRRKVQQKLGNKLEPAEYTRLVEYEMQQMEELHELITFEGIETSNALLQSCQAQLSQDEVTLATLRESYSATPPEGPLDIVTY